jgi:hypothetical protein
MQKIHKKRNPIQRIAAITHETVIVATLSQRKISQRIVPTVPTEEQNIPRGFNPQKFLLNP